MEASGVEPESENPFAGTTTRLAPFCLSEDGNETDHLSQLAQLNLG